MAEKTPRKVAVSSHRRAVFRREKKPTAPASPPDDAAPPLAPISLATSMGFLAAMTRMPL